MRIAICGYGVMGRNHYRVLSRMPEVDIAAICDPYVEDTPDVTVYRSLHDLLDSEPLDGIVISMPTSLHRDAALQCIENGMDILVEKPLASTVQEGHEIQRALKRHPVKFAVGHVERFNPVVQSLIDELKGKKIYSISITRVGPFPPRITDAGVLVDLSVHDIDLVGYITKTEEIAESRVFKAHKCNGNGTHEDNAVIAFKLKNDTIATITTNWLTPFKKRTIEVATNHAFYTADLMSQELIEYSDYTENNSFVVRSCRVVKGEPLLGELRAFLHFAATGEPDGLASLEDGLRPLEVIGRERCDLAAHGYASLSPEAAAR